MQTANNSKHDKGNFFHFDSFYFNKYIENAYFLIIGIVNSFSSDFIVIKYNPEL